MVGCACAVLLFGVAVAIQDCSPDVSDDASLLQWKKDWGKEDDGEPDWMKPPGSMKPWWQQKPWWKKQHKKKPCTTTTAPPPTPAPPCPYNFEPPKCVDAEPQTPRDLTPGAEGKKIPKAATLTVAQSDMLPLANIHFHLGAEHKSEAYNDGKESVEFDAKFDKEGKAQVKGLPRPGWMCSNANLTKDKLMPYEFKFCKIGVEVGKSYEVHYVHSSAGYTKKDIDGVPIDIIDDGLGGAANGRGQLNPMITVQAQIFHIVNGGPNLRHLAKGWQVAGVENAVMYPGSTTGTSFDNEVCSPYAITWHVDLACHQIAPESFDELCKEMKETYGLEKDLNAHGSRILVDPDFVVKKEYVMPLA